MLALKLRTQAQNLVGPSNPGYNVFLCNKPTKYWNMSGQELLQQLIFLKLDRSRYTTKLAFKKVSKPLRIKTLRT